MARVLRDDQLLGEAEVRRGTALLMLGRSAEGYEVLEAALPLVEAAGDLVALSSALTNLGGCCWSLGWFQQRRQYSQQALEVAERIGNPSLICFALSALGDALLYLGEQPEVRPVLRRAMSVAETTLRGWHGGSLPWMIGLLALREGDWDEARRSLQSSLAASEEAGDRQAREVTQTYLAELDVLEGRPEEAVKRLEPLIAEEHLWRAWILPRLAWAYLCLPDEKHLQQAAETAERAVARGRELPGFLADALWINGMVLIRQGRHDKAQQVLSEGLALARSMPFPYMEARILEQLGILQTQRGEPEQAQTRWEESLAIFQRLGAKKDVERLESERAALGRSADPAQ
jgi:tetratricopeptide (TPR) repeat protein